MWPPPPTAHHARARPLIRPSGKASRGEDVACPVPPHARGGRGIEALFVSRGKGSKQELEGGVLWRVMRVRCEVTVTRNRACNDGGSRGL